jgi:L-lactate dehydrogenase complex protein LldF
VRIDIPRMLIDLRREVADEKIAPWTERAVFKLLARLLQHPRLYRLATRAGRLLQRPWVVERRISRLPLVFGEWTRTRDLPPVAPRTFQERWASDESLRA